MVKKSSTPAAPSPLISTPPSVQEVVVPDAPVKSKPSRSKKVVKDDVKPEPEPVKVDTPETNVSYELSPVVVDINDKLTEFSKQLISLLSNVSTLKNNYKSLEKFVSRELKNAKKASSKKRRVNVNRKPSGFMKPTPISDELAVFLGKPVGSEMARTEVTKEINSYIRQHNLQDKTNGRKITPDASLSKLLRLGKDDELTYLNLQRYMTHHFIKPAESA